MTPIETTEQALAAKATAAAETRTKAEAVKAARAQLLDKHRAAVDACEANAASIANGETVRGSGTADVLAAKSDLDMNARAQEIADAKVVAAVVDHQQAAFTHGRHEIRAARLALAEDCDAVQGLADQFGRRPKGNG